MPVPYAKKSLGQHFLKHDHICDRIAALAQPAASDWIVEIGPGPGALTRAVERLPHARLFLLEKDERFARERQREASGGTQAILIDALRFPWARLSPHRPWKILGNLPYNVASPLIWDIVSRARGLNRAVFMVQKEVGQRLAAAPAAMWQPGAVVSPSRRGMAVMMISTSSTGEPVRSPHCSASRTPDRAASARAGGRSLAASLGFSGRKSPRRRALPEPRGRGAT